MNSDAVHRALNLRSLSPNPNRHTVPTVWYSLSAVAEAHEQGRGTKSLRYEVQGGHERFADIAELTTEMLAEPLKTADNLVGSSMIPNLQQQGNWEHSSAAR